MILETLSAAVLALAPCGGAPKQVPCKPETVVVSRAVSPAGPGVAQSVERRSTKRAAARKATGARGFDSRRPAARDTFSYQIGKADDCAAIRIKDTERWLDWCKKMAPTCERCRDLVLVYKGKEYEHRFADLVADRDSMPAGFGGVAIPPNETAPYDLETRLVPSPSPFLPASASVLYRPHRSCWPKILGGALLVGAGVAIASSGDHFHGYGPTAPPAGDDGCGGGHHHHGHKH